MAMSSSGMAGEIISALSVLNAKYENIIDDHRLGGFDLDSYSAEYWTAVSGAIVNHIKNNAKAIGLDTPNLDDHNLDII